MEMILVLRKSAEYINWMILFGRFFVWGGVEGGLNKELTFNPKNHFKI